MSQFFTLGGQSIRVSASASVLPMNIQDLFPLGWTGWISLQSKGFSRVFSNTTVQKHQFLRCSVLFCFLLLFLLSVLCLHYFWKIIFTCQNIGTSASASVLPMNIQDLFPLGWTDWISLQSKGFSRVFSNTIVQKHQFFGAQLSSQSNSHIHT